MSDYVPPAGDAPPITRADIDAAYESFGCPRDRWRVGGEFERHLLRPDGTPVPYFGEHGIAWLFGRMVEHGWTPRYEGDNPIAMVRDDASITLEPGGQFELSGSPSFHAGDVVAQARTFIREIDEAKGDAPIHQVALGYTPYAAIEDIPWVPKGRYGVMRQVLAQTGDLGHAMMKGTAAVQASFDFSNEADCARKVRLGVLLGPLTTALFANSPLTEGKPNGWQSWRGQIWTRTDPARTGFPAAALSFTYQGWIDWLLDVPMLFFRQHGQWALAHGRTFRQWLDHGIDGTYPTAADWELHLTSVFPEVRVKRTIEVRGADCVPLPLAASFVALFKGLFYCNRAADDALEIAERLASHGTQRERFAVACKDGLGGVVGGRALAAWAEELLDVSHGGISRCDPEDVPLLQPLIDQVQTGESPAAAVLRAWERDPSPGALIEAARLQWRQD